MFNLLKAIVIGALLFFYVSVTNAQDDYTGTGYFAVHIEEQWLKLSYDGVIGERDIIKKITSRFTNLVDLKTGRTLKNNKFLCFYYIDKKLLNELRHLPDSTADVISGKITI